MGKGVFIPREELKLIQKKNQKQSRKQARIISIDVARGLTLVFMLICNNQGYTIRYYEQLNHAPWHGVTLADFAFPFFLMIMGTAVPIVVDKKISKGESVTKMIVDITKRSIILIFLGLVLNFISKPDLDIIRIPGVLQRLGFVYFTTAIIYLVISKIVSNKKSVIYTLLAIAGVIIVGYYVVSKPYGFEMERNLPMVIDSMVFKEHLHTPQFDPEGLVSNIAAIASGLIGCAIGCIITDTKTKDFKKLGKLIILGVALLGAAFIFNKLVPFNKRLWTSSYMLLMGGSYSIFLGVLYLICDIGGVKKLFTPVIAFGISPLFVYFVSEVIEKLVHKAPVSLFEYITLNFITPVVGNVYDSLVFAVLYTFLWMVVMLVLYKKGKVIKI